LADDSDFTTVKAPPEFEPGPERLFLVGLLGPDAGAEFPLNRPTMILGRGPGASLVVSDTAASRRHVRILLVPDPEHTQERVVVVQDMQSTNGLFVNGERVTKAVLRGGEKVAVGKTVYRLEKRDNFDAAFYDRLHQMATTDPLTGAGNRWALEQELERQESERIRYKRQFSLVMVDIDHFKQVNQACGHAGGDEALRLVASVILSNLRDSDRVFRYGGDEFVALLAQTDAAGARIVAERIRSGVANLRFAPLGERVPLTVTIGGAEAGDSAPLDRADKALFEAKNAGRDRVHLASPETGPTKIRTAKLGKEP
jgi:diguanylate cyclase (GGDEF)-like protein